MDEQDRLKQEKCKSLTVSPSGKMLVSIILNVPMAEDARAEAARSAVLAKLPEDDAVTARTYMNMIDVYVSEAGLAALCAEPMAKSVSRTELLRPQ